MPRLPIPRWFLVSALLIGGLYFLRHERREAVGEFARPIARLLDDRCNPHSGDFPGRRVRFCQVLATLEDARKDNILPVQVLAQACESLAVTPEGEKLLTDAATNNLAIARRMGLLDGDRLEMLRAGELPEIASGAFVGDEIDFEYVIPISQAPELARHFANLELRRTSQLGDFAQSHSRKADRAKADGFYRANLITQSSYLRIGAELEGDEW